MTTLHPRGTVRARFESSDPVDAVFRRLGLGARHCDLGDQGLYLAEEIVAADRWLGGSDPEALGILVLALMVALRQGSTRLPLDGPGKGHLRTLVADIVKLADLEAADESPIAEVAPVVPDFQAPARHSLSTIMKRIARLTGAPSFNSVIGTRDARLPLIIDDGCLYTERMRHVEIQVATHIAARLAAPTTMPPVAIADIGHDLIPEQQRAVERALSGQLTVITGGPGTGKTRVAAAIVNGLARAGIADIAVAAPTGRAANRLTELLARDASLPAPIVAQTIHRLLGYRGHRVVHHSGNPLAVGALIVDEASMIDLELVAALLDALPAHAPLVLIGDAHQLPAIDAGRILADLVSLEPTGFARIAALEHSHRMNAADPRGRQILEAARAIQTGAGHRLTERHEPLAIARTPGTLTFSGVEWVDAGEGAATARSVAAALWHHFDGAKAQRTANDTVFRFRDGLIVPEQAATLRGLWNVLCQARVLTATRGLPTGAVALNAHLHALALDRITVSGTPEFLPGEPVMMTANDYQRGLWNGDQGIIVRADEGLGHHRYRAVFRVGSEFVPFAIEALRDRLERAWAMTIHKSQGSELEAVAIALPDADVPLLTRELLYTAITRARTSVVVCGSRAAIASGAKRSALRNSGLADRIRAMICR